MSARPTFNLNFERLRCLKIRDYGFAAYIASIMASAPLLDSIELDGE